MLVRTTRDLTNILTDDIQIPANTVVSTDPDQPLTPAQEAGIAWSEALVPHASLKVWYKGKSYRLPPGWYEEVGEEK